MKPIVIKPPTWLNAIVLIALCVALYFNLSWPWGLLFLYWAVPSIVSGQAVLVGPISRDESPILFWAVAVLWVLLGLMMILIDAAPTLVEKL